MEKNGEHYVISQPILVNTLTDNNDDEMFMKGKLWMVTEAC
jgi:hypothetical protein